LREYPEHPIPAVAAVIRRNGRVLLVKRENEPGAGLWSLPGGAVELGESVKEALAREVLEETSVEVRIGKPLAVVDKIVRDEKGRVKYHYVIVDFECSIVSGKPKAASDALSIAWVEEERLNEYKLTESTRRLLKGLSGRAVGEVRAIGFVRENNDDYTVIEVYSEFSDGLKGLEEFSHAIIIGCMHVCDNSLDRGVLTVRPMRDPRNPLVGVFASRSQARPNPMGLNVARILEVGESFLRVERLDFFEGTPIIDIKPYTLADQKLDIQVPSWLKRKSESCEK